MRFKLRERRQEKHSWFAWRPVIARRKEPHGYDYFVVWLSSVNRMRISVGSISQWQYEL